MLASSPRLDIFWSPSNRDNYIVFGSEITLYKVNEIDHRYGLSDQSLRLSDTTYGKYLSHAESQFPKCMSWYPNSDRDYLVAVGQADGSIAITSLDQKKNDDLIAKEFAPKHGRPCCCVAWSLDSSAPTMLAAGLDKYRTDTSLLIWDVNRISHDKPFASPDKHSVSFTPELSDATQLGKPIAEFGSSEATYSIAWTSTNTIITGMNKYLRVVDLRTDKFAKTTQTKAVFGICIDPQNEERGIVSYIENQVYIWDMRRFDKALHTLPMQKSTIVKLGWCPKRLGLLACLSKESTAIRIFDIQHSSSGHFEYEQTYSERPVESPHGQLLASFDWHPFDENRLMVVTVNGTVSDIKLFERIALDMNPCDVKQELVYSQVKRFDLFPFDNHDDISSLMRQRAINMYGLPRTDSERLAVLEMEGSSDKPEAMLWRWAGHLSNLIESDSSFSKPHSEAHSSTRFIGATHITKGLHSKTVHIKWEGEGADKLSPLVHYQSEERDKCLKICKWPCKSLADLYKLMSGDDSKTATEAYERRDCVSMVTRRLELEGSYEKATAIALFHGRIDEALKILNRGAEYAVLHGLHSGTNLSIVAMALAGINMANNALWLSKCKELHKNINDPYLRATFSFLTCGDDYSSIIMELDISIGDRVAFACLFLPDEKLTTYLYLLQNNVIELGSLPGVLVTGLEEAGVDLLQQYIDNTGDIQTATLIIIHSFPSRMQQDERVQSWIEHYRNLLDKWKLWVLRAKFDIFHKEVTEKSTDTTTSQVYLSCYYCSKPIMPLQMQHRRMYNASGYGLKSNTIKMTVCNECRKPLPRCSLCLKNMGTASGILSVKQVSSHSKSSDDRGDLNKDGRGKKKTDRVNTCSPFDDWFTWCQSCHHGGHSNHIEDWFKRNMECPVSGCTCKCASLDSVPALEQLDQHT